MISTPLTGPSIPHLFTQVAFSLSLGWGGILTLASYKTFHAHVIRDSIMIVCITCFTAIFCGFVIFAVLGTCHGVYGGWLLCLLSLSLLPLFIYHSLFITRYSPLVIHHSLSITCNQPLVINCFLSTTFCQTFFIHHFLRCRSDGGSDGCGGGRCCFRRCGLGFYRLS